MACFQPACAGPACAIQNIPEPDNSYQAFLRSSDRAGRFLVEATLVPKSRAPLRIPYLPACGAPACSISSPEGTVEPDVRLTLSDHPVAFEPTDRLRPNVASEARLARRVDIETTFSIVPNTNSAGQVLTGDVELFNADGWVDRFVTDYNVDGQTVRILFGPEGGSYQEYRLVESRFGKDWQGDEREIRLTLQDIQYRIDRPFQESRYGGSGGAEGTSDLLGRLKPRLLGERLQFAPILIDRANYVYQINDGPIEELSWIADGGSRYTDSGIDAATYAALVSASLEEGEYAVSTLLGMVRIRPAGGSPASVVTCRARGSSRSIGTMVVKELRERAGFAASEIEESSFNQLNSFAGGYWYDGSADETLRSVITSLIGDTNSRLISDSKLRVARIIDPASTSSANEVVAEQIISFEPEGVLYPPVYRFAVRYAENDRPLTFEETLLPGDDQAFKESLRDAFLEMVKTDSGVLARNKAAQREVIINTNLLDAGSAETLGTLVQSLWRDNRQIYRVTMNREGLFFNEGSIVRIIYPRFGFSDGRNALIVNKRNDYNTQQAEIRILV